MPDICNWEAWEERTRIHFYSALVLDYWCQMRRHAMPPEDVLVKWKAECDAHIATKRARLESAADDMDAYHEDKTLRLLGA